MRTIAFALASLTACFARRTRMVSRGLRSSHYVETQRSQKVRHFSNPQLKQSQSEGRFEVSNSQRALAKYMFTVKCPTAAWHAALPVIRHRCSRPLIRCSKLHSAASSSRSNSMANKATPASRAVGIMMRSKQLDEFERSALAGLWSGNLDLDDGFQTMTCQLLESGACTAAASGSASASSKCMWEAQFKKVDDSGTTKLSMKVWMGDLVLQGEGARDSGSLRCRSVEGIVLEGYDEPVYVGRFAMNLTFPSADADELVKLEARHKRRVDSQPQPARFRLGAFVGRWKLLLALDTQSSLFTVELDEDGRFKSIQSGDVCLGGSWGVFDAMRWRNGDTNIKRRVSRGFGIETPLLGTHLLLRVERSKCSGLPQVHQSYSLWGQPDLSSPHAEIVAKSPGGSGYVDSVNGHCYLGASSDRDWFLTGRFSLERAAGDDTGI